MWDNILEPDQVQWWIVEFSIKRGKLQEFERLARDISDVVRRSEPGTRRYEWFLDKKRGKCLVIESYDSTVSGIAHAKGQAVKRLLPEILKIAKISRFEVCGNPSKELLQELADVNANVCAYIGGFSR